jgi:hypothetical protein
MPIRSTDLSAYVPVAITSTRPIARLPKALSRITALPLSEGSRQSSLKLIRGWLDGPFRDQGNGPRFDGTARGGFMETETMMQPDDANPMPLRMSHQGLGTLIIRFVGLLFLSVTALALVWIH